MIDSFLSAKATRPSSSILFEMLSIFVKCSFISSRVANYIQLQSMFKPSSYRPKSFFPSRLRLKQVRRYRSCWLISSLVVKTTVTEAMISSPTRTSWTVSCTPCPLIISRSCPTFSLACDFTLRERLIGIIIEIIIEMFTRFLKWGFASEKWHHTTILALKREGQTVIIGDGQVSLGSTKVKIDARKIRKMNDGVYCGFAGSLADAFYLIEGLEQVMSKYPKQTLKSCISYAKEWRTGKQIRHLEATLVVIDKDLIVELDGTGNVLEIEDVIGIGSGGLYAECAARALIGHTKLTGEEIAQEAMKIAASKCIYTSDRFVMEKIV